MIIEKMQAAQRVSAKSVSNVSEFGAEVADLVALLRAVEVGDETALEQLYEKTVNHVHALTTRILGAGPDAEEITEDVYLYVWRNANVYQAEQGHPLARLVTIARSRAIDRYRYREKHRRIAGALALEPSSELSIEYESLVDLHAKGLHECIAALPETQRQILTLAYFRGLTQAEIADYLCMSLGTVKSHIRRTLIALRLEVEA